MTSWDVEETKEWFGSWSRREYARMGAIAERDVILPAGTSVNLVLSNVRTHLDSIYQPALWRPLSSFHGASAPRPRTL